MPIITNLKPQRKNQSRVNVHLDGHYAFALSLEELVKNSLKTGLALSEKQVEELVGQSEVQKLLDRALVWLGRRPCSEKELVTYLRRKSKLSFMIDRVLVRLKELGLVDDQAFAVWWVEQRSSFRPKGRRALTAELRQKGVGQSVIAEVLSDLNEEDLARQASKKKQRALRHLSDKDRYQKLIAFLSRRGFSWEIIKRVLEQEAV